MGLSERRHQRDGNDFRDRWGEPNGDLTAQGCVDIRGACPYLVQFGCDPRSVLEHFTPLLREHHASSVAREKRDAQLLFEHAHLSAECRLSDP
jgi:hypothetical protein